MDVADRGRRAGSVDSDELAVRAANVAGDIHDPRLVGEARVVGVRGVVVGPSTGALHNVMPTGTAVAADLHLLAGTERAIGARDDERAVLGVEVGSTGIIRDRGDVDCGRRRNGVDYDWRSVRICTRVTGCVGHGDPEIARGWPTNNSRQICNAGKVACRDGVRSIGCDCRSGDPKGEICVCIMQRYRAADFGRAGERQRRQIRNIVRLRLAGI